MIEENEIETQDPNGHLDSSPVLLKEENPLNELALRPQTLGDYIGQDEVKNNLRIFIAACKKRNEAMEHLLLHGAPGLGKTTLAHIIAREMNAQIRITSGPAIEKQGDLAALLSNLQAGDVLFIDEIHRLRPAVEEILYSAMEDFCLDLMVGKGPSARSIRLSLPRFTLIGATTKLSSISSPLRDRFGNVIKLEFYGDSEIEKILRRSSELLQMEINEAAAKKLAICSRKTPRIANRLLRRVRDLSQVNEHDGIGLNSVIETLDLLGIDELGLDSTDKKIMTVIADKFKGGPVGLSTLSAATNEEPETLEDIYEPFLLQMGFLERSPRGRLLTEKGYNHLGLKFVK